MRRCSCWRRSSATSARGHAWPPSPRTGWWLSRTCAGSWSGTGSRSWSDSCRCGGPERAGAAGRPAGRDPECVCHPAAGLNASRGPGAGAFAVVTGELVRTAVELANHQVEVPQLRGRVRSSSRKLAEVAQELVQDVQRERVAAKALDDARVRAAEARAREAEQALQAAQTGLARRTAALTETKMSWPRATGPLMTATISPTLASGPPMYATGSPTNPSSGRVEGAAGTNELGSVRTVPRRQVLLCSGATRKWGHPTRHLPPLPAAVGPPATPPRVPRVGRWPGSRSRR